MYYDKSTGLFGSGLPPVVEVVEPVADPEPPKSTGPFGVELLPVPEGVELVPDPVPLNSTGLVDWEPPVPAVEPSVGLPQVRTIPGGEEIPGSKTAVIDPKPPKESCPNPASIARDSRRSITGRSAEARGGFLVFRRFKGLLLGRPLRRGHIPPLGIQPRKSFISVKESVGDGIQLGDGGESNPRGSCGKGLFPGR